MNGKDVEKITGISRRNLRFYEDQGLIEPARNPENDYRDYSDEDIEKLKIIRSLRTIDVPVETIGDYFKGKITLDKLADNQEKRLEEKQKEVEMALNICKELHNIEDFTGNTVDSLLKQMDKPEVKKSLFNDWLNDYKQAAEYADKDFFYVMPEKPIKTRDDMTIALLDYAEEKNMKIEFIKEGLNPTFKLNGITYSASCANSSYTNMSDVMYPEIFCQALNLDEIYKKPLTRKQKVMAFFHNWWGYFVFIFLADVLTAINWGPNVLKEPAFWLATAALIGLGFFANGMKKAPFHYWRGSEKTSKKESDK